jgi:hypothetical protein
MNYEFIRPKKTNGVVEEDSELNIVLDRQWHPFT